MSPGVTTGQGSSRTGSGSDEILVVDVASSTGTLAHVLNRGRLHKLRHFLFTWLKTQGIDVLIQPYSGHETRQSPEI